MTLRIAKIIHDSVTDGPGLRAAVYFQGCPHFCPGCHNPELLDFNGGEDWTAEGLFYEIGRNPLVTGVTFSGGEPMAQARALFPVAALLKQCGYDLWIYTGYLWEELTGAGARLAKLCDVVADGRYEADKRSLLLPWRGSANQRLIDVKKSLNQNKIIEWHG
jgi:anaerobic ribonucleoside-triphosphate reductase activating protein